MSKNSQKPTKSNGITTSAKIIGLLRRNTGTTIVDIAKATGWKRHSVYGFVYGKLRKKRGFQIISTKEGTKDGRYRIKPSVQ